MALAISCLTVIINMTNEPWNDDDKKAFNRASSHCYELYKDAPCLVKFIKREPRTYWAICGGNNE